MTQASSDLQKVAEEKKQHRARTSHRPVTWILCVLVGGVALACNLFQLGSQSMWFDEILSFERASQSLPVLWRIVNTTQPNMALYYIFLHFWLQFTALLGLNPTEFVIRLPSAIFAALSSVMVFLLGRRFLGLAAGLTAAGLYLLNGQQLIYAQETRSYALQLLLICITWYALFAIVSGNTHQKRWWLCFALATVLAVYVHLFSALILVAQVVAFGGLLALPGTPGPWRTQARQQLRMFIVCLVGIFLLLIPGIYTSRSGSKTGWLPIPHPMDVYLLFLTISANSRIYLALLVAFCILGLFVAVLAYQAWGKRLLSRLSLVDTAEDQYDQRLSHFQQLLPVGFALLCWVIVPIVLSYIISYSSTRLFSARYLVTIVPAFVLLVGLGIAVVRWRVVQVVLVLGLLLLTIHYVPLYYQRQQAEDWNTTSFWLERHYQTNDGLACYNNTQGCQISIEYYLTAYPSAAHFTPDSPGSFSWVNYDLTNHLGNADPAVDPQALAVFASHHPRIFFIVGRLSGNSQVTRVQTAQQWLDSHYHFLAQIVTRTVTIRLYATG
ncbi:MAG TPA: glycosyltransferase family 39 protein [Ktedonobacteraceae bacterium]|nr:glycosyltransferase family 39 protein [Ktedonobacteraceae bacterium]